VQARRALSVDQRQLLRLAWIFAAVIPFVLLLRRRSHKAEAPADVERPAANLSVLVLMATR
jgi:hypothetical protein